MTPVLEFENVWRSYGSAPPTLQGVNLSISPGEVVGLVGRNGAGKTTLIRIGMGMLYPHGGLVRVFGLSPTDAAVAVKSRIGYVAEDQVLPPNSTVADLTAFHRYLFPRWDYAMEQHLLERFALREGAKIKQLSKGQARQVALLCAVCHRPELLILDEPGGGLDPIVRREFLETAIQLLNREGTSILFSSHHMSDVERIGGRVALLDGGAIRFDRDLAGLREEVCLAMIPGGHGVDAEAIGRIQGCIRVRPVLDDWHAVMEGAPGAVQRRLETALGIEGVRCVPVPLEDLFIELAGGERVEQVR
jgi:ABC-2 type transport system ATP-binding protein